MPPGGDGIACCFLFQNKLQPNIFFFLLVLLPGICLSLKRLNQGLPGLLSPAWPVWIKNKSELVYLCGHFFFIWLKMLCSILQKEASNLRKKMFILIKFKTAYGIQILTYKCWDFKGMWCIFNTGLGPPSTYFICQSTDCLQLFYCQYFNYFRLRRAGMSGSQKFITWTLIECKPEPLITCIIRSEITGFICWLVGLCLLVLLLY